MVCNCHMSCHITKTRKNDRVTCIHSAPGHNVDREKGMEEVPAIMVAFPDVLFPRCHVMSCTDC